jgi:hypothetical protein
VRSDHAVRMVRVLLPDAPAGRPFSVAEGRQAGLGEARMYGADLKRPTHGVRMVGEAGTLPVRAAATLLALPDDVAFSHATAAQLWDCRCPAISRTDRWLSCGPPGVRGSAGRAARAIAAWSRARCES